MNGEGLLGKASPPMIDAIVKHDMRNLILEQYHILLSKFDASLESNQSIL